MEGSDPFDIGANPIEANISEPIRGRNKYSVVIDDWQFLEYRVACQQSGIIPQSSLIDEQV